MSRYSLLGIDIGYGNLKVAYGDGKTPQVLILPGGVGDYKHLTHRGRAGAADSFLEDGFRVRVPDRDPGGHPIERDMVAGVDRSRLPTVPLIHHQGFHHTSDYLALYYAAVSAAIGDTSDPTPRVERVVTGLPVSLATRSAEREWLAAHLRGKHRINDHTTVSVEEVSVVPQPSGGFWDAAVQLLSATCQGAITQGRVLVLDPGYFSLDWAIYDRGYMSKTASGSNNMAMHGLLLYVQSAFRAKFDEELGLATIDRAIRGGQPTILWQGRDFDLVPMLDAAARAMGNDVVTELRNARQFDREKVDLVVLVGGGAKFYVPVAKAVFPHSEIAVSPEPVAANARGFWFAAVASRARAVKTA